MKSISYSAAAAAVYLFFASVSSTPNLEAMTALQDFRNGAVPPETLRSFECVLPYVSRGGIVTIVSSSAMDLTVEIDVMNAYRYDIVVPKQSVHTFEAPSYAGLNRPVVDGGPISFKSSEPIAVSTVLANLLTVPCSELNQRTKLFVGTATTRVALVNTTPLPIQVQIFRDNEQTAAATWTVAAKERKLLLLENLVVASGTHAYRVVADRDGFGFAVISPGN